MSNEQYAVALSLENVEDSLITVSKLLLQFWEFVSVESRVSVHADSKCALYQLTSFVERLKPYEGLIRGAANTLELECVKIAAAVDMMLEIKAVG